MGEYSIGQAVPRTEDPRLLRGGGRYVDDVSFTDQAFGYVLRSPHASAVINAIDLQAAAAAPGVLAILTADDYLADGLGRLPLSAPPNPRFDFEAMFAPRRLPLAEGRVRYVGDPVAFVVAESRNQARDAAELIEVDYAPAPAHTATGSALEDGVPVVYADHQRTDNTSFVYELGDAEATEAAFAKAAHTVTQRLIINRVSANAMEARGCAAQWDAYADTATIYVGVQGAFGARRQFANVIFGEAENNFRVVTGDMGGSFGMKGAFYPEYALVAWAARRLARPVKWFADRSESFMSDNHARDNVSDAELALSKDGEFLGLRVRTIAALGAYPSTLAAGPPTGNLGGLSGPYRTPAAYVNVTGVYTNTNPTAAYRGAGRPEASYVMERLVDLAADKLDIDPAELRRRNMIAPDALPYKTPTGFNLDSGDFERTLEIALEHGDYEGFAKRRSESEAAGKIRGLGISYSVERAGAGVETGEIRFEPSGTVTIICGTTNHGQGHATIYTQMACGMLGIAPELVRVVEGDTGQAQYGGGTGGSKVSSVGTSSVYYAANKIIDKARAIAAHLLETAEADIEFDEGTFTVAGTDKSISMAEVAQTAFMPAKLPPGLEPGMAATGTTNLSPTFPNGCHLCELEIDPDTGAIEVVKYTVVDDVGTVLNPLLLAGQIHGGIAQGAGQILEEHIHYDPESGQLLSGSFMDYAMPRAEGFCNIEMHENSTHTEHNPLGVKGAGEAGTVGAMPAVMNAIVDALSPYGVTHLDMPATPERVWRVIHRARAAA